MFSSMYFCLALFIYWCWMSLVIILFFGFVCFCRAITLKYVMNCILVLVLVWNFFSRSDDSNQVIVSSVIIGSTSSLLLLYKVLIEQKHIYLQQSFNRTKTDLFTTYLFTTKNIFIYNHLFITLYNLVIYNKKKRRYFQYCCYYLFRNF